MVCRLVELDFINWCDLNWSFLNYCLVTRYVFNQASRGPLHKAAVSGEYKTVKMLLESGEDVDQRDQVLVFSSLCNFCVKPQARLLAFAWLGDFYFLFYVSRKYTYKFWLKNKIMKWNLALMFPWRLVFSSDRIGVVIRILRSSEITVLVPFATPSLTIKRNLGRWSRKQKQKN